MNYACYWIFRHGIKAKELDYFLQEREREIMVWQIEKVRFSFYC